MAEQGSGGPRKIAEEKNVQKPAGEPKGYCGACGLPDEKCDCRSYKEWGTEGSSSKGKKG